jgi:hypothetical protein
LGRGEAGVQAEAFEAVFGLVVGELRGGGVVNWA